MQNFCIYFNIRTYFFHFIYSLFKTLNIKSSILPYIFIKILFFYQFFYYFPKSSLSSNKTKTTFLSLSELTLSSATSLFFLPNPRLFFPSKPKTLFPLSQLFFTSFPNPSLSLSSSTTRFTPLHRPPCCTDQPDPNPSTTRSAKTKATRSTNRSVWR